MNYLEKQEAETPNADYYFIMVRFAKESRLEIQKIESEEKLKQRISDEGLFFEKYSYSGNIPIFVVTV